MKLWQKGYSLNEAVENYTVGNDYIIDEKLVYFDCKASIAHATMLFKQGIINEDEKNDLIDSLNEIITLNAKNEFKIEKEQEDCHTAIEVYLTQKLGEAGKKIHTGRSRNDQVITAFRLYEKQALINIKELLNDFINECKIVCENNKDINIPGYTHMQRAMPSSIKMWLESFINSANDNLLALNTVFELIDQNPLGSAAGFGVPVFNIDKQLTAKLMGFEKVMENPMHVQLSRGKLEAQVINVCSMIMHDLNRLATDIIMFSMKEFQFLKLPVELCTGSSIMPQKKNPDVLELMRAKFHVVIGEEFKLKSMTSNLISGYNRDMQLTKEPVFNCVDITMSSLQIIITVLNKICVNSSNCENAMSEELYATEEAYRLVKNGMSFREAYKKVGEKYLKK
jgi:argininosuccinate lyase